MLAAVICLVVIVVLWDVVWFGLFDWLFGKQLDQIYTVVFYMIFTYVKIDT